MANLIRKLRAIFWVVLGRPLVYRVKFKGDVNFSNRNTNLLVMDADCTER